MRKLLLVVALITLAGCSSGGAQAEPTTSVSETPSTESTSTTVADPFPYDVDEVRETALRIVDQTIDRVGSVQFASMCTSLKSGSDLAQAMFQGASLDELKKRFPYTSSYEGFEGRERAQREEVQWNEILSEIAGDQVDRMIERCG